MTIRRNRHHVVGAAIVGMLLLGLSIGNAGAQATPSGEVANDAQQILTIPGPSTTWQMGTARVVPTSGGHDFVAISAQAVPCGDCHWDQVFFFRDTTYLGTATTTTRASSAFADSATAGPGQIAVEYTHYAPSDPLCCASLQPVTITYTLQGDKVVADGTPPDR